MTKNFTLAAIALVTLAGTTAARANEEACGASTNTDAAVPAAGIDHLSMPIVVDEAEVGSTVYGNICYTTGMSTREADFAVSDSGAVVLPKYNTIVISDGGGTTVLKAFGYKAEALPDHDVTITYGADASVAIPIVAANYAACAVTPGEYVTACYPYEVAKRNDAYCGITGKVVDASGKVVGIRVDPLDHAPAPGEPFLIKASEAERVIPFTAQDEEYAGEGLQANGLVGNLGAEVCAPAGSYVLYQGQIQLVDTDNVTIGQNRAYLCLDDVPEVMADAAEEAALTAAGGATGYYKLYGQSTSGNAAGIVVSTDGRVIFQ